MKPVFWVFAAIMIFSAVIAGNAQPVKRIFFISDTQEPMEVEKMFLKPYRNEEARDSLFADILRSRPRELFFLGDLVSKGSNKKAWMPVDKFLQALKKSGSTYFAIPGNHDYMGDPSHMKEFRKRFPEKWLYGYLEVIDSIAVVMLNSNVKHLSINVLQSQLRWYDSVMDSLDLAPDVSSVIVCTHHPPYSNSAVVGSSQPMQKLVVPQFEKSKKSLLFISGHSHNLEYFSDSIGKHFLVIGGGGGLKQPLEPTEKRSYYDLLSQDSKPLYFYLIIDKVSGSLNLMARGFGKDFQFFDFQVGSIPFK